MGITKKQLIMVIVLLSGTFTAVLNATLLTPALPTIMVDMGVASTTVQWLTSGYALVEAIVIPLSAYLMGRFSTRRLFVGGMSLFAAGSLVAAISPNFAVLLAGRMMQAAATGAIMPMVSSVILLVFPRERRGSAMGIIGLIIGFAPTIGPSLSGVLVDLVGWRMIFAIITALSLLIVVVALFALEDFGEFKRTKFDLVSVILSSVGLVCLLYGLSSISSSATLVVPIALIAVGAILMAVYARRQLTLDEPMLRVGILKTRNYRIAVCVIALFQMGLIGMETIMPLYIQGVLGQSATVSGLTLLPGALIGALTGYFAGHLFDRLGVRRPVLIGSVIIVIAALGFTALRVDTPIPIVAITYACMPLGIQFTMTPMNTWGVNSLANEDIQHAQGTSNTINQVAGSFGTALLVSISAAVSSSASDLSGAEQAFAGYHMSLVSMALIVIAAAVIIVVFVRDREAGAAKGASTAEVRAARPGGLSVRNAMNATAPYVTVGATVGDVLNIMASTETSGVAVVDERGALVGYVSDGDVARYLGRSDKSYMNPSANVYTIIQDDDDLRGRLAELAAVDVMKLATKRVITVDADLPLDKACTVLAERKIKKVPVTSDGVLVGALSRRNVVHCLMAEMPDGATMS
ncbi:MAG: DHA2 family efflux MFS transporter permease subunit [Coriobacteriia bacterium]|nr:DHA2 family efflux MFS transporter permease subunit [Coriobacteriia bacterium]MBS5478829.1 DHA2 family efflux MFS transporter permease subunit [Coriobacteriia bacterium]